MKNETTINAKIQAIFKVTTEWDILAHYHMDEADAHAQDHHYSVAQREEAKAVAYAICSGQLKELLKLFGIPQPVI